MTKTLIVIPIQKEFDFFVQACQELALSLEKVSLGRLEGISIPALDLIVAQGGLGKAQFAVQTQHLIDCAPDWELVICAGAAGGIGEMLKAGDVVIGTETVEHDIRNRFGPIPKVPRFASDQAVVEALTQVNVPGAAFSVYSGPIASGDEDIVSEERRLEVQAKTGALATAWEGAGGARASHFSGMPFVEIRGISDMTNESSAHDFTNNLEQTIKHIVQVIVAWAWQQ